MKLTVQKNHLGCQILYGSPDPQKKRRQDSKSSEKKLYRYSHLAQFGPYVGGPQTYCLLQKYSPQVTIYFYRSNVPCYSS